MSRFVPATLLLIAGFLGQYGMLAPLHLLILFGVGHYLIHKISPVLPPHARESAVARRAEHQFDLAIYAGAGAVFAFKLCQAFSYALERETRKELFAEILAIVLVSLGVLLFIEPVAGFWRTKLGLEEHHAQMIGRSKSVKLAFFGILAVTSLAHGFLHRQIENEVEDDPVRALIRILGATLIAGGITYAWSCGACREKPRAARFGILTGALVGLSVVSLTLFVSGKAQPFQTAEATVEAEAINPLPVASEIFHNAQENHSQPKIRERWELDLQKIVLPWTILALVGGLVIDRGRGKRASRDVALAIVVSAAIFFLAAAIISAQLKGTGFYVTKEEMVAHILAVGGWALSLVAFPSADKALAVTHGQRRTYLKILGPGIRPPGA